MSDGNVRNLNSRSAIAKKLFYTWPPPFFLLDTPEIFCSVVLTNLYTLRNYFSFEKRQVFKFWKYSGVKVWQSHFKEIIELIKSIIVILSLSVFLTFTQIFQIVIEKDIFRSSHRRCFVTKGVLRNFAKLTGKHLCQSPFLHQSLIITKDRKICADLRGQI